MDSKQRFSDRVDAYVKYRPGYPAEMLDYLYKAAGLRPNSLVADIGSGTGIFSRLLLERGSGVIGVEPNAAMRTAAIELLGGNPGYTSVDGSAEATGLADASVEGIVCAQSFHWFDRERAKREFQRILRPGGKVALVWNSRRTQGNDFLEQYERLFLTYGTDYVAVSHRNITERELSQFFAPHEMKVERFTNGQRFDFAGLAGRTLSSSYAPAPGHPRHEPMMEALRRLFERSSVDGTVTIEYETEVYVGSV